MGKGYNNYMTKKFFHPGSKDNIKRVWMAQQKAEFEKTKEDEMDAQYQREQEMYENRALLGDQKAKLGLSFMYDPPPGAKKVLEKEDDEPEYKFEWQRRFNAPREQYAKGDETIRDQPFGIEVRNVRCIKCHTWGHVNTDKICPLYGKNLTAEPPQPGPAPSSLVQGMKEEGLVFKKCVTAKKVNPDDPNEQMLPSDEDEDPEVRFLKSLTPKQKKKLLKKLDKLAKHQKDGKKRKKKGKRRREDSSSTDEDESDDKKKHKRKGKRKDSSSTDSDDSGQDSKKDDSKRTHDRHPNPVSVEAQDVEHKRESMGEGSAAVKREQEKSGINERTQHHGGSRHGDRDDGHSNTRREKREASAERLDRDVRRKEYQERRHGGRDGNDSKETKREDRERRSRERETSRRERNDSGRNDDSRDSKRGDRERERRSRDRETSRKERNDSGRNDNDSRDSKREDRERERRSRDRETSRRERNDSGRDSASRHARREHDRGRDNDSGRDKERGDATRKVRRDEREAAQRPHGRTTSRAVSSTDKRPGKAPRKYTPHSPSRSPSSSASDRSPRRSSARLPKRSRHDSSSSD